MQTYITALHTAIQSAIERAYGKNDWAEHLAELDDGLAIIAEKTIALGDRCDAMLSEEVTDTELLHAQIVHFIWADHIKAYLILWRNILFEHQKAYVLHLDKKVEDEALTLLRSRSQATLLEAAADVMAEYEKAKHTIEISDVSIRQHLNRWKLRTSPWPEYRRQFQKISQQGALILRRSKQLHAIHEDMFQIRMLVVETITQCEGEIIEVKSQVQKIKENIEENIEEKPGRIAAFLDTAETDMMQNDQLHAYTTVLDKKMTHFEERLQVPVRAIGGVLQYKDIYFRKSVQEWLNSEILPPLYEIEESTQNVRNGIKMAFVNIRNRAILLSKENADNRQGDSGKEGILQFLDTFLKKVQGWERELWKYKDIAIQRLDDSFYVSQTYHPQRNFLPYSMQSSINNRLENEWVKQLREWIYARVGSVRNIITSVEKEEALSISEKVVRFVQSRQPNLEDNTYSGIFLTKGYIGESFWAGRDKELEHVRTLIEQWKKGLSRCSVIAWPPVFRTHTVWRSDQSPLFS